jgi:hypothetical protein
MPKTYVKDPAAQLDYTVDWTTWLDGRTIAASVFTVPVGLTKVSESNDTTSATVIVSGGSAGLAYTITNQITTSTGLVDERSFIIRVQDR